MKKVITYGTFDLFHQGHYNILKRAKEYGDYLIVGITSESFDIERGKIGVRDSLATRIENVRKTGFADEIIIEEFQGQKILDVQKYNIDVLVIGSDWYGKFEYLKPYCQVVYLERTKNISSTQLRQKEFFLQFGIITESLDDHDIVLETKYISGIHLDRVYSEKVDVSEEFSQKYELNSAYSALSPFLNGIDAVFINLKDSSIRYRYIKSVLQAGKHVFCHFPSDMHEEQLVELIELARKKDVVLLDCLYLAYMQAFNQMLWMEESGTIGKCIEVKCAISNAGIPELTEEIMRQYAMYTVYRICPVTEPFEQLVYHRQIDNRKQLTNIMLKFPQTSVNLELATGIPLECGLTIRGEKGTLFVPDDWWNTGYFELIKNGDRLKKRYCYNHEGTGMRYTLRELLIMLRENKNEPIRLSYQTSIELLQLYKQVFKVNAENE